MEFTPVLLYVDSNSGIRSNHPFYDYRRHGQSSFRSFGMVVVDGGGGIILVVVLEVAAAIQSEFFVFKFLTFFVGGMFGVF